ncbi:MAG: hypothetical protein ACTSUR_02260, partial [Candidatus Heimdallarchaeaceae archaeon]
FNYVLNSKGPKPDLLIVISPQEKYKTPFWLPALGYIPSFIMNFIQKLIIIFYRAYLRMKKTQDSENVSWAADRLAKNDAWALRRYVFEFIINYDIKDRQKEISMPLLMFVGEKDYFVNPEISKKFLYNQASEIVTVKTTLHRIHEKNEDFIAKKCHDFVEKNLQ